MDAVKPANLFQQRIDVQGTRLVTAGFQMELAPFRRITLVGAGKASAAMAVAFESLVLPKIRQSIPKMQIDGWINCPEGSFDAGYKGDVTLFEARPAGVNMPTEKAVYGTQKILDLVSGHDSQRLILCLLSGGGSALLTSPCDGVTLEDKLPYNAPEPLPFSVRHWLGALQLEMKQFAAAEKTYREEVADHPHNGWSLFGLREALKAQGKAFEEEEADFLQSWARSDTRITSSRF